MFRRDNWQRNLREVLERAPGDVPEGIASLQRIQEVLEQPPLRETNPIASFNSLYLKITQCVLDDLDQGRFRNSTFLERLDVEFALRYLRAVRAWVSGGQEAAPRCWRVLF